MHLKDEIDDFKAQMGELESMIRTQETIISKNKSRLKEIETNKVAHVKAIGVLDRAIQIISSNGIGKVETLVSDGLKLIFNSDYKFIIERKEGTKGESYRIMLEKDGFTASPIGTVGGGIINVISFLLRVIMIQRFKLSKLIVLDESFNNISKDHIDLVSEMVKTLCDDYGYTVLLVTHQPQFASHADRIFKVSEGPTLHEVTIDTLGLDAESEKSQY